MKKNLSFFLWTIVGLSLGLVFYLSYIHVISWLAYPIGILVLLAVIVVAFLALGNFFVNIKDFIVSIFKDDDTRNEKGFKKNL